MMTLIVAAAAAAGQPAPATAPEPAQHAPMMQMGDHSAGQHAMKEKCCCDDMAKNEGHEMQHGHPAR